VERNAVGNGRRPGGAGLRLRTVGAGPGPGSTKGRPDLRAVGTSRARVVIGIHDLGFHQEVLDFLQRDPRIELLGAASEPDRLVKLVSGPGPAPELMVVCPTTARGLRHPAVSRGIPRLVIISQEMTVPVLREAIDVGAEGIFCWPDERDELADVLAAAGTPAVGDGAARGRVIAVLGSRGGAGVTFVATNLAGVFADRGLGTVVVDFDQAFAGLTVALGVGAETPNRTIGDLAPVVHELSPQHVHDALHRHPRGFAALLAPREVGGTAPGALVTASVALLAGEFEVVILHVPHGMNDLVRLAVGLADQIVLVATADLFSLYGAKRVISALELDMEAGRFVLVANRRARTDPGASDLERVLEIPPAVRVRFDASVARRQDRAELLPSRAGRAARDLRALSRLLLPQPAKSGRRGR
jgi:pilus assembly protein CpaE